MKNRTQGLSIPKRIESNKTTILEQLRKTPIVQVACSRAGVGRATYYRWRKRDKDFAQKTDKAIFEGRLFINDLAESKLLSAIQEQNMTGIIFWLKHNHPQYTTRVEISTKPKDKDKLTEKQAKLINKSLTLAGLLPERIKHESKKL